MSEPNSRSRSLAVRGPNELSDSRLKLRSVRSATSKHWQSPEGLSPEEVRAVIAAASCERDRLLLRVLWATGARISEVLALRPMDVQRDSLVLPNRKKPNLPIKRVFLPGAELGLTGELLLWAKEQGVANNEPLFFSRKRDSSGSRRALQRGQAWLIVKEASERANVRVLALRASSMVRLARRHRFTLTCFAMRVCGRSCAPLAICRSLSAKPVGPACRWRTCLSVTRKPAGSCAS